MIYADKKYCFARFLYETMWRGRSLSKLKVEMTQWSRYMKHLNVLKIWFKWVWTRVSSVKRGWWQQLKKHGRCEQPVANSPPRRTPNWLKGSRYGSICWKTFETKLTWLRLGEPDLIITLKFINCAGHTKLRIIDNRFNYVCHPTCGFIISVSFLHSMFDTHSCVRTIKIWDCIRGSNNTQKELPYLYDCLMRIHILCLEGKYREEAPVPGGTRKTEERWGYHPRSTS